MWRSEPQPRVPAAITAPLGAVAELWPLGGVITRMGNTTTLYRPVGQKELDLIAQTDHRAFPPRLSWQPIFYPVLSLDYAIQIARDWNTKDADNGCVGYVTRFEVDSAYLVQFTIQRVGGIEHLEYWIPAEELATFNSNIVGRIDVIHEFRRKPMGIAT
jgi:hypothetical protein